jgi:hypothetical protein
MELKPLKGKIFAQVQFKELKSRGGIHMLNDEGKHHGVHPRWAKIWKLGEGVKDDISPGQWILVEHGRWTQKFLWKNPDTGIEHYFHAIDPKAIMCVQDEVPEEHEDVII